MNNLKWEHEYIREYKCPWSFKLALAPRHQCVLFYINTKIFLGFSQIYITCYMILKAD